MSSVTFSRKRITFVRTLNDKAYGISSSRPPVDMIAWTEVTEDILNIYKQSCRLKACIFALCIEGSITVSINLMDTEIKQGDFITLLPGTIIQFYEQKEKVCLGFVGFSSHCLNESTSSSLH